MKKTLIALCGIVVGSWMCAAPARSSTITLQYDDGAGIDVSAHAYRPDDNYDGDDNLYLYSNEGGVSNPATSYLRFVMPWCLRDAGVSVQLAELRANLYSYGNWGGSTTAVVGAAGVTQAWEEKTLTWNNKPATDATSTATDSVSGIPGSVTPTDQWCQWDVTPLVKDWLGDVRPNHGVVLRCDNPNNRNQLSYHASEATDPADRPILEIEYTGTPIRQPEVARYDWEQTDFREIHDKVGLNDSFLVAANGSPGQVAFRDGTGGLFSRSTKDVLAGATDWNELKITGAVTLSAWIQPDSSTLGASSYDNPTIVGKYGNTTGTERAYVLNIDDGKLVMTVSADGTSTNYQTVSQDVATMSAGGAYHVAGVFRPGQNMELYINGSSVKTDSTALASIHDSPLPLTVGGMYWSGSYLNAFGGVIDDVRIYDRALEDPEVRWSYHVDAHDPVLAYREIFPSNGSNLTPLDTADWKGYMGSTGTELDTSVAGWSELCISPYEGGGSANPVNSHPAYAQHDVGYLYNGRATKTNYLYYTDEFEILTGQVDAFCWNQSLSTETDVFRAVLQIDGTDWYASEQTFSGSDWEVLRILDFDTANWLALNFVPGTSLSLGGSVAPPDGLITAFGLYNDNMTTYGRFDNFQIWAVPEPSTLLLLAIGALAAVMFRRRTDGGRKACLQ